MAVVSLLCFLLALGAIWVAAWVFFAKTPGGTVVLNTVAVSLIVMALVGLSLFWCLQ